MTSNKALLGVVFVGSVGLLAGIVITRELGERPPGIRVEDGDRVLNDPMIGLTQPITFRVVNFSSQASFVLGAEDGG